nr:hypothetical protein [Tanacetum cinerariifolium]
MSILTWAVDRNGRSRIKGISPSSGTALGNMNLCYGPDTVYGQCSIQRISDKSTMVVEIDFTWSLGFVSVEPEARISLMMFKFSSCLLADSAMNLASDSSLVSLQAWLLLKVFLRPSIDNPLYSVVPCIVRIQPEQHALLLTGLFVSSGSENKDANEHIEKVLEIVDLFHIPKVTQDQIMLRAFPVSLTGAVSRWLRNQPSGSITTWEVLKTKFLSKYCPPARTAKKMKEINNFQQNPMKAFSVYGRDLKNY